MAQFSTAGYGQPLDLSGVAGALQQMRQRQQQQQQQQEAERKKQAIGQILQKYTDSTGQVDFQSGKLFTEIYNFDPQIAYQIKKMGMEQQKMGQKGKTQPPASQWLKVKLPGGKVIHARASRDPSGNPTLEPGVFQGKQAEVVPEVESRVNEAGEVLVTNLQEKTVTPLIDPRTKKPMKDPGALKGIEQTRQGWADLALAKKREDRQVQEWLGKISPREKKEGGRMRVSQTLQGIERFYDNLNAMGGIRNVDKEVLNNIWATTKASWLGQQVGKVAGTKEQAVREMIGSTRPLLVQYIRQASEMGARGMDSQQELNFYLQAATDPASMSYQSNINAIKMLDQAYGLNAPKGTPYFDVNKVLDKYSGKAKPSGLTDAEWEELKELEAEGYGD